MTDTMFPGTDRLPLSPAATRIADEGARPFGLSVAHWDAFARFERDKVSVDPETQMGKVGDRPLRELITAGTTCQVNSDGKDVLVLDYPVDDR